MTGRGTTNTNVRGNTEDRRRRREWLVETFRANVDAGVATDGHGVIVYPLDRNGPASWGGVPACRCYRCGALLTVDTVTADRIIPGCQGGTYRRTNLRPACARCNSSTGGALARRGAA